MESVHAAIVELLMFFIVFPVTFKAMMAVNIAKHFQRGAIWQIQIMTIFISVVLSYLFVRAIMHMIELSTIIFGG